jgi:hypothetical protein
VDNGIPVSKNYKKKDHFPFTGQIDMVTITLTAPDTDRHPDVLNFIHHKLTNTCKFFSAPRFFC